MLLYSYRVLTYSYYAHLFLTPQRRCSTDADGFSTDSGHDHVSNTNIATLFGGFRSSSPSCHKLLGRFATCKHFISPQRGAFSFWCGGPKLVGNIRNLRTKHRPTHIRFNLIEHPLVGFQLSESYVVHQFSEATSGKNCIYGRKSYSKEPNMNKKRGWIGSLPIQVWYIYLRIS